MRNIQNVQGGAIMMIQHNMLAANTSRQKEITRKNNIKATEKLASGYRINRAADDAAGLSISEKMRGQIRGLEKASSNIQDGISLVQTAEGALNEVQSMLQRMRELAVQAANDTNTEEDRMHIQMEIDQLIEEVDRITYETEFNTIKVLRGGVETSSSEGESIGGLPAWVNRTTDGYLSSGYTNYYAGEVISVSSVSGNPRIISTKSMKDDPANDYKKMEYKVETDPISGSDFVYEYKDGSRTTTAPISMANISTDPLVSAYAAYLTTAGDVVTIDTAKTSIKHDATMVDFNSVNAANIKDLVKPNNPQGFYSTCCTCTQRYSIKFVDTGSTPSSIDSSGGHMIFNINLNTLINDPTVDGTKFVDHFLSELASLSGNSEIKSDDGLESYGVQMLGHFTSVTKDNINLPGQLIIYDGRANDPSYTGYDSHVSKIMSNIQGFAGTATAGGGYGLFGVGVYYSREDISANSLFIQAGANSMQYIKLPWPYVSSDFLGIDALSIMPDDMDFPIEKLDHALSIVSNHRVTYGAYQNRMEHAIGNALNSAENLQTAESLIRDTDMASTMVSYSKDNILQQYQDSLLAQTKNAGQGILTLLQNG